MKTRTCINSLLIALTALLIGTACMSTQKYYPEFDETMTRREARQRYRAFNERQKNAGVEDEEKTQRERFALARDRKDSLMATMPKSIEVETAGLERFNWDSVVFTAGTYVDKQSGGPFSGFLESWHPNGRKALEAAVIDGTLMGDVIEYHPNGQLKMKRNYYLGEMVGQVEEYFANGDLKLKANITGQSMSGGDAISKVTVGFFDKGKYRQRRIRRGRLQMINSGQRTEGRNAVMPLEEQKGYMLFGSSLMGEKPYTSDSRWITAPASSDPYENAMVRGNTLTSSDMQADVLMLKKILIDVHPGLYRYNTPEEFEAKFDAFYAKLGRDMSEAEFMKLLAQFTFEIRCGHTYVNPWNMKADIRERLFGGAIYLPLGFEILDDNRMIVTRYAGADKSVQKGAEILSINGIAAKTIIDSLYTIAKIDGNNLPARASKIDLRAFSARDFNMFDFYFQLFFPMEKPVFELEVKNIGASNSINIQEEAMTIQQRADRMAAVYGDDVLDTETWSFEIRNDDLAVMTLPTFATWNMKGFDPNAFYHDAFAELNRRNVKNLVIDIRRNSGGLAEPRDTLISYLSDKTMGCEDTPKVLLRTTKADSSYKKYVNTWEDIIWNGIPEQFYKDEGNGYFELTIESECSTVKPQAQANRFNGNTYILGGPANVSSTFILLQSAQKHGYATYVGRPSGGNSQGINGGSYFFTYLPNSSFEVDVPLKYFAARSAQPDGALSPDVSVQYSQKHIAEGRDADMEAVLTLIENK